MLPTSFILPATNHQTYACPTSVPNHGLVSVTSTLELSIIFCFHSSSIFDWAPPQMNKVFFLNGNLGRSTHLGVFSDPS
ncbi:hypothetical protein DSO57_1005273 [Entomophthora muscae]|uniref:Uncharacterized protein n=1 Tax=Entomophthora muscae TaxID=34485 RepID=A0ACC2SWW9_9FUNG|nr:hypothetical protein DSO57_1005273 [Entomophthora muscae]